MSGIVSERDREILDEYKGVTDPGQRWEDGIPHRPESVELIRHLMALDFHLHGDSLALKFGGDGDNGEFLAFLLDMWFERLANQRKETDSVKTDGGTK